ncbi:MAG: hypothetical protein WAL61_09980, partial [Acidimicrobiales bacterium]
MHAILAAMRGIPGRHLQLGLVAAMAAIAAPVLLGACGGSGSPTPTSPANHSSTTTTGSGAPATTVPAPPSGPLTLGGPIAIPFSAA